MDFIKCLCSWCLIGFFIVLMMQIADFHEINVGSNGNAVGTPCIETTDCPTNGMYCNSQKRCDCLPTFVNIGGTCWQKINPDESGCAYNRQCSAVWPGAFCSNGQCKCANSQPSFQTNEGKVCLNYGYCPINGNNAKFREEGGTVENCDSDDAFPCRPGYECICGEINNCTRSGALRFCCPMRGLACIQGLDEGYSPPTAGGGISTRYYHNPITGNCETFQYRGDGGNANNFESKEQCESYCKTYCARGDPELDDPIPSLTEMPKSSVTTCVNNNCRDTNLYACDMISSTSYCCPKPSFICSPRGGLDYTTKGFITPVSFDEGSSGGRSISIPRYYYNETERRCKSFMYRGQGGNLNNFLTLSHCESFCAKTVCGAGEPLKDITGITNLLCPANACPNSHECTGGVCCPKRQTVCSLPKAPGSCGNYVERWWFNAKTGNCERFLYSGCQENANNFDTYLTCQSFCRDSNVEPQCLQGKALKDSNDKYIVCGGASSGVTVCPGNYDCYFDGNTYGCCPTKAFTCSQMFEPGTSCGPRVMRWYFNQAQRRCLSFEFNGCDAQPNNFASQQDCEDYCLAGGCLDGGEPYRDGRGQYQVCGNGIGCPFTHYCTQVTLAAPATFNYCCPTKTYICSLPRDSGQLCLSTSTTRYFFNTATRNCEVFNYNGCGGNRNSFATVTQCLNYCNSAGCPPGTIALRDPTTNTLTPCQVGITNSCPTDYVCANSQLLGQGVCCGVPLSVGKCPTGQSPYLDALSNTELQCQPNVAGGCPGGYFCYFSQASQAYYCCGTATNHCPRGGSPFIDGGTNIARQCTPGIPAACPTAYECQATSIFINGFPATTGYCCGQGSTCSNGGTALLSNNQPVTCQPGGTKCQAGYECTYSSSNNQYYCCTPGPITTAAVCGVGGRPFVVDNRPVVCSSASTIANCPAPYSCVLYQPMNTFFCCQTDVSTTNQECPVGQSPLLDSSNQYVFCAPNQPSACPFNYYCQYITGLKKFICCGIGGRIIPTGTGCPNNAPFMESLNGQPKACRPGRLSQCSDDYVCTFNSNFRKNVCCQNQISLPPAPPPSTPSTGDQYGCPKGRSYLYPGLGIPIQCSQSGSMCPSSYACLKSTRYPGFQCCSTIKAKSASFATETKPIAAIDFKYKRWHLSGQRAIDDYRQPNFALGEEIAQPVQYKALNPGDTGCTSDNQCQASGEANARCSVGGRCLCSSHLLVHNGRCVGSCPWPMRNLGGVCEGLGPTLLQDGDISSICNITGCEAATKENR